jgi:hypothetical protein
LLDKLCVLTVNDANRQHRDKVRAAWRWPVARRTRIWRKKPASRAVVLRRLVRSEDGWCRAEQVSNEQ